jgi:peptidylprolyl isomerase
MKHTILILLMAASAVAASAQTPAKPAVPATTKAKPAASATKPPAAVAGTVKLPPGVPPVPGIQKIAFSLRCQDIKIGTGAEAEPNKMYKVHYTGWISAPGTPDDGRKFDSSYDHPGQPLKDKDGKPVLGDDGKPKLGDPQPMAFPQGMSRLISGFDQGFEGMKIGGKRRLFIPWQLAYGAKGRPGPDAAHPGIPPKADLIFDVELVDVTDLPMPPNHPPIGGIPGGRPMPPKPGTPGAPPNPAQSGAPTTPPTPATPAAPPTPTAPAASPAPAAPASPAAKPVPAATPTPAAPAAAPALAAPAAPATPPAPAQPK